MYLVWTKRAWNKPYPSIMYEKPDLEAPKKNNDLVQHIKYHKIANEHLHYTIEKLSEIYPCLSVDTA